MDVAVEFFICLFVSLCAVKFRLVALEHYNGASDPSLRLRTKLLWNGFYFSQKSFFQTAVIKGMKAMSEWAAVSVDL